MRPADIPETAATWGTAGGRSVYLVHFDESRPLSNRCSLCGSDVPEGKDSEKEWEKHAASHRVWWYADTNERYYDGLSQHRHCECCRLFDKYHKPWCPDCGGYVPLEKLRESDKTWLRSNRISQTKSGIPLIWPN